MKEKKPTNVKVNKFLLLVFKMLALYSYGTRAMNEVSLLYTSLPDCGLVEQWSSTPFHPAEPLELGESCLDLDPCGALRTVCVCLLVCWCVGVCACVSV